MENYDAWLTKQEVRQRIGISERTLERKIQDGEIRRQYRNVPGRKPLAIIHPKDVEKLQNKTLKPVPVKANRKGTNNAVSLRTPQKDMAAFMTAFMAASPVLAEKKFYLSLKEASQLSGLPMSYLKRKITEGIVPAVKVPGWRIRREDLARYDAVTGTMAE